MSRRITPVLVGGHVMLVVGSGPFACRVSTCTSDGTAGTSSGGVQYNTEP